MDESAMVHKNKEPVTSQPAREVKLGSPRLYSLWVAWELGQREPGRKEKLQKGEAEEGPGKKCPERTTKYK